MTDKPDALQAIWDAISIYKLESGKTVGQIIVKGNDKINLCNLVLDAARHEHKMDAALTRQPVQPISRCNECGAEYPSAPVGTIHKCGACSGGYCQPVQPSAPYGKVHTDGSRSGGMPPGTNAPAPQDDLTLGTRCTMCGVAAPASLWRECDRPECVYRPYADVPRDVAKSWRAKAENYQQERADALADIADMMANHVENWPAPKKLKTAIALIGKTLDAMIPKETHNAKLAAAEARELSLLAALDPDKTKAAYIGEFYWTEDALVKGAICHYKLTVPWTTIKEIMAAIKARAALAPEAAQGIEANGWQDIASAPRDEMLLSWADGMVRLVMWEAGKWVQVGATIEPGWYEPTHWRPLPTAPEAEQ